MQLYSPLLRKRVSSKGSPHHPLSSLLIIWILPLLESVLAGHAHFPAVCTSHVITHLLSDNDEPEPEPDDTNAATAAEKTSYDVCLANWANDSSNGAAAAVADETERDDKVSSFNSHRLW